jgi:hypothetical protein
MRTDLLKENSRVVIPRIDLLSVVVCQVLTFSFDGKGYFSENTNFAGLMLLALLTLPWNFIFFIIFGWAFFHNAMPIAFVAL